jgi:hypothetical protein
MRPNTTLGEGVIRVTVWARDEGEARAQLLWILADLGRRLQGAALLTQADGEYLFECSTTSYMADVDSYAS